MLLTRYHSDARRRRVGRTSDLCNLNRMSRYNFTAELAAWGPESAAPPASLDEARSYCRQLARRHYENFTVASWLLPGHLRQHFYNVYAYCRWADDLADETGDPLRSLELLAWWQRQLEACYRGRAEHP